MTLPRPRRRTVLTALILTYLGIQLGLPLPGLVHHPYDTRANFSWNMYTVNWTCRGGYRVETPTGSLPLDLRRHFRRSSQVNHIAHSDTLPMLHRWMCRTFARGNETPDIRGNLECSLSKGREFHRFVTPTTNICTAPYGGVIPYR